MSATTSQKHAGGDRARLSPAELRAWRGFLRVQAKLLHELDTDLLRDHGLSLSSYDVLVTLGGAPDRRMRMSDLAHAVLLSRSGLTRLVDRLEREGLVERCSCPSDARGANAALTDGGAAKLRAVRPAHLAAVRERFLGRLSERELEQLATLWDRIAPG